MDWGVSAWQEAHREKDQDFDLHHMFISQLSEALLAISLNQIL